MNKFSDFFGRYVDVDKMPKELRENDITNVKIDSGSRSLDIHVKLPSILSKDELYRSEELLSKSVLDLMQCHIHPEYDPELFDENYYPELTKELKRRYASLNGTLNGSSARINGDEFIISLSHGGSDILLQQDMDKKLSSLIREEFSLNYRIRFDGVISIDSDSQTYIEQQKINEEKVIREMLIEEQQQYESMMQAGAEHKEKYAKKPAAAPEAPAAAAAPAAGS